MAEVMVSSDEGVNDDGVWFCQWHMLGVVDLDEDRMRKAGLTSHESLGILMAELEEAGADIPVDAEVVECYPEFGGALKVVASDGQPLFLIFF